MDASYMPDKFATLFGQVLFALALTYNFLFYLIQNKMCTKVDAKFSQFSPILYPEPNFLLARIKKAKSGQA